MNRGLSLLEILVSVVILAMIMTGVAAVFLTGKRHIVLSRSELAGTELQKNFLAVLPKDVRQDTWNQSPLDPPPNNLLTVGNYKSTNNSFGAYSGYATVSWFAEPALDNVTYYPVYQVVNKDGLRRVKFTLVWEEPLP